VRTDGHPIRDALRRCEMKKDPVCGMNVGEGKAAATAVYDGKTYYFCAQGCKARFDTSPETYAART